MKWLISILIALGFAVVVAMNAKVDSGYVMLAYGKWSVEMSGVLLALILIIAFSAFYYTIRFLAGVKQIPTRTKNWNVSRKQTKGNNGLTKGLLQLTEGRWIESEKTLLKHAGNSHAPLLNYLAAARAAHEAGKYQKRDYYLKLAREKFPSEKVAIEITNAELQFQQGKYEQSLAAIKQLKQIVPNNKRVLSLLAKLYQQLEDWDNLKDLLVVIRKLNVMGYDVLYQLTTECHYQLLKKAGENEDVAVLQRTWSEVPKEQRLNKKFLLKYGQLLVDKNSSEPLEPLLRKAIHNKWDTDFVYLYGKVNGNNATRQLATAESWLAKHDNDPVLLLTLGRLCMRNHLWGKAREYISLSVDNGGSEEACYILAQLLEKLGETDDAMQYYEKGLSIAVDPFPIELPKLALTEESPSTQRLTLISNK